MASNGQIHFDENLLYDPGRQIDVTWAGEKKASYAIELEVVTEDRPGLLAEVTQAIAGEGSNIRRIEARVEETREAFVAVSLETSDLKQLEKIVSRIRAIKGVRDVVRKYNVPKAGERSELRRASQAQAGPRDLAVRRDLRTGLGPRGRLCGRLLPRAG
jgi:predicted amino acid-binding ACT domain protein